MNSACASCEPPRAFNAKIQTVLQSIPPPISTHSSITHAELAPNTQKEFSRTHSVEMCDLTLDESATGRYDTQTGCTGIKHCNKNIFHSKCVIVFEINSEITNICSSKEGRLYRNLKWNRHLLSWWRLVQVCKSVTMQKRHKTISFHFLFYRKISKQDSTQLYHLTV